MALGGLQFFFQCLADYLAYIFDPTNRLGSSKNSFADRASLPSWAAKKKITAGSRDLLGCRVDCCGQFSNGLGGIIFAPGQLPVAAARELVDALRAHKTQIIPLELMASAGMIFTYAEMLRGEDIFFLIDNQSVCCPLVQGCSRSWDIQLLSTA